MDSKFLRADELGIRLEIVAGLPIWEPHPLYRHQKAIDRIRTTIQRKQPTETQQPACSCVHIADVYVSFPDGSLKRPDIAIFCQEPSEEEEDEAIKMKTARNSVSGTVGILKESICDPPHPNPLPAGRGNFCANLLTWNYAHASIKIVPEAVIEIVSKGYEAKDLEIGLHFYLSQGVKDVVVFDPYTLFVLHVRRDGTTRQVSPVAIAFECGCTCTV